MNRTATVSPVADIESSDVYDSDTRQTIESPSPEFAAGDSRRLMVTHSIRRDLQTRVARGETVRQDVLFLDSATETVDSSNYGNPRRYCDSEESEPPRYHSLKAVPQLHSYPAVVKGAGEEAVDEKSRALNLPPKLPFWRKQQDARSCTTSNSYRSLQESLRSPNSHYGREFSRREIAREISERMSETYLYTLRYCGLPIVIKPRKAAMYTIFLLIVVNVLAVILSWASLFGDVPSPSVIAYTPTIVLGVSAVPAFFTFWAYKCNPFAALSAFSSTAFSGTFVAGLSEAFFVANNIDAFEDTKMAALGSASAAFNIISSVLWLFVVILSLIFYIADSQQRIHYVIQFISFNCFAILELVTFLLTLLMDIVFFDKVGQLGIMYLAVGFSLLSVVFSFFFCFCTGVALKERDSSDRDEWSRFITLLPFAVSAILTVWTFICGVLSMVVGTTLSHDEDERELYGGSVAALAYLVGTLNFGVSIATISVGCILGVHMFSR